MSAGDSRPPSDDSADRSDVDSTPVETYGAGRPSDDEQSLFTRFRTAQTGPLMFVREVLTSVLAVLLIGLLLFAISGVWPPMVAVQSGSMEPHMYKGDLIFITQPGRFVSDATYDDTGVVTYRDGKEADYKSFHSYGSVVIYDNPNRFGPPIIHRARFWVDDGENWYKKANKDYVYADSCAELRNCPAPHAGFITKGDANGQYDQANGISSPVKPTWVTGIARLRIPYLGWIRLGFSGAAFTSSPTNVGVAAASQGTSAANATVTNATVTNATAANDASITSVAASSGTANTTATHRASTLSASVSTGGISKATVSSGASAAATA